MHSFTIVRQIDAPVATVWEVLDDFGEIQQWNPGVKQSALTSAGEVAEGSTRSCQFAPFGGVNERISTYVPQQRMEIHLYETFKLPISDAVADFNIAEKDGGTELTLNYSYTPNLMGRLMKGMTRSQMEKGIGGLAKSLQRESERVASGAT